MPLSEPAPRLPRLTLAEVTEREIEGLSDEALRVVLLMRRGFGHTREHTHEEVGETLAIGKERARQLEQIALAKLRRAREQNTGLGSAQLYLARLSVLYRYPARLRISAELYRREMGPTQWIEEFGGGSYGKVLAHFKELEKHDWLKRCHTEKKVAGRGRARTFYRATELAIIDDETWSALPRSIQAALSLHGLQLIEEQVGGALAKGTVARDDDLPFFCRRSIATDQHGWRMAMAALRECFYSLCQEQAASKARLANAGEAGIAMTVALAGFESSASPRTDTAGLLDHPLRLGEDRGRSLASEIAKILSESLSLQMLKETQDKPMSARQLYAKLGGAKIQSFERRCRALAESGWLVKVGRAAESPPILYEAAGPELVAHLWGKEIIPDAARQAVRWPVLEKFCTEAGQALRGGSFDARPDRHVTLCTFLLDARGRMQAKVALQRCKERLFRVDSGALGHSRQEASTRCFATFLMASYYEGH